MRKSIHKAAVLGAGTMGARIAAHFANAGIPVLLLDIATPGANQSERNKIAKAGLEAARKDKPAAFFDPSSWRLVTTGNFEDDLPKLAEVDWIVEAVVENLEIKRELLKKVEAVRRAGSIITTNTSGLPVSKIAAGVFGGFSPLLVRHALFQSAALYAAGGDHSHARDGQCLDGCGGGFCDVQLGKGVVVAKDTPNFIANRIGVFTMLNTYAADAGDGA